MKQYEAIIKVMEENGGYATLGFLYQNALKTTGVSWKTKTPFASIRRIVQDGRFFFKIKPGLWALKTFKDKLPEDICPDAGTPVRKKEEYSHSYYQGLLLEIGNLKKFETFVTPQDQHKRYLKKELGEISTLKALYAFSYDNIVRKAQSVDVIWFNQRRMPASFFEIEHTTNISNALLKFVELSDFYAHFYIVADQNRKKEFSNKLSQSAFTPLDSRVQFIDYDTVSNWNAKVHELSLIEQNILSI